MILIGLLSIHFYKGAWGGGGGGDQHRYIRLRISCKTIKFKTKDVCII